MIRRVFLMVLDSFGIGLAPDAAAFSDAGANTLASVRRSPAFSVPELAKLGLFAIPGNEPDPYRTPAPVGAFARMREASAGKDTVIGHWEIAGLVSPTPFPTYPDGFPPELLARLSAAIGREFLCNRPYSGTQVLRDYGEEHLKTGKYILYTSGDSVMQIAAHESLIPPEELYAACRAARALLVPPHAVGRVIARPFAGDAPDFYRTPRRHDFALPAPGDTLCDVLARAGLATIAVGKIRDIFDGRGISRAIPTQNNADGMRETLALAHESFTGLCFVNLVDFDMLYGHRRDVDGYATALTAFDRFLPELRAALRPDDLLMLTADHGCDPAYTGTDHTRETTPWLIAGDAVLPGPLGVRDTFADIGKTIAGCFGVPNTLAGTDCAPLFLKGVAP